MKRLALFALTIFAINLSAQITITSADMPIKGDTLRYSAAVIDSLGIVNFNISGANSAWDFSHVTAEKQGVARYVAGSQTPYGSTFNSPSAFGRKTADSLELQGNVVTNVYEFFSNSSSSFLRNGLGANYILNIANTFSDPDEVYQFPLDYGDIDSSTFKLTANISIFGSFHSEGYRKNVVDGFGTIITPNGTYNCLRVRTDLVSRDSVSAAGQNVGFRSIIREYKWLANGERLPVMQVNGTLINGDFVPTTLLYRDSKRNVSNDFGPKAEFTISTTNPVINKDTVQIVSQTIDEGRTACEFQFSPNTVTFVNNSSRFSPRPELTFDAVGFYTIQFFVSNTNGSDDSTYVDHVYATLNSSVNENSLLESSLNVYPNPIHNQAYTVTFELENNSNILFELLDVTGRRLDITDGGSRSKGVHTYENPIEINDYNGVLFLRIHTNEGYSTRKLVID